MSMYGDTVYCIQSYHIEGQFRLAKTDLTLATTSDTQVVTEAKINLNDPNDKIYAPQYHPMALEVRLKEDSEDVMIYCVISSSAEIKTIKI